MDNPENLWHKLTVARSSDEDEARREYMTKAILVTLISALLVSTLLLVIEWYAGLFTINAPITTAVIALVLTAGWWLAHLGHWRWGRFTLLAIFSLTALYLTYSHGLEPDTLFAYTLLILLSTILLSRKAQWITLGLCIAAIASTGWVHTQRHPGTNIVHPVITISISLTIITLLLRFFAGQYEHAITRSHSVMAELAQEIINHKQAEETIRQKSQDLTLLNSLNTAVNRGDSLQAIIHLLATETENMTSSHGSTVYLLSDDKKSLVMQNLVLSQAVVGQIEDLIGTRIPVIEIPLNPGSLYLETLQAGKPRLVNDSATIQRLLAEFGKAIFASDHPPHGTLEELVPLVHKTTGIQSIIDVPLGSEGKTIGILEFSYKERLIEADLHRLDVISGQLSAIIEHKRAEDALWQAHAELETRVEERTTELVQTNERLREEIIERVRIQDRLAKINECFLNFGPDPTENIKRLTSLCGELLEATCALYNRLDSDLLCSVGQWRTPLDYEPVDKPDGHICYDVIKQERGTILVVRDLLSSPYAQTDPNVIPYQLQTYIGTGVNCGDVCIGSLCAVYQEDLLPSESDERTIGILASAIGVEEEHKLAEESLQKSRADLERSVAELESLHHIGVAISSTLKTETLLQLIVEQASILVGADSCSILLPDEETNELVFHAAVDGVIGIRIPPGQGIAARTLQSGTAQIIHETSADLEHYARIEQEGGVRVRSLLTVPLMIQDRGVGVLTAVNKHEGQFTEQDRDVLMTLGSHAASAIENARLYERAQREIAERVRAEEELRQHRDMLEELVEERTIELIKTNDQLRRDIIERKLAEAALFRAKEDAEKSARAAKAASLAKSTFLANMSHELRTPLNAILGFSELMTRDPGLSAEQQDNLETINRSGEHLLTLINDVLELSKIEVGRVVLQEENFDLHRLLADLEEMFRMRAESKNLTLILEQTQDVPRYVQADESKLRQILSNLLDNAVKFTHTGSITLRATGAGHKIETRKFASSSTPPHSPPTPYSILHFQVEDTGSGITPKELDAVFDAFVQTSSGRESQQGTGLGMPISRQFVRMMGGDLAVESPPRSIFDWSHTGASKPSPQPEKNPGTLFKFDIQVKLADTSDVPVAQPTRRVIGLEPGQCAPDGSSFRLLVVEDVQANRKLLVKLLETINSSRPDSPPDFEIREAINGQQALDIWEEWEPHLIWMDIRMPGIDGYEATRRIKAAPKGQNTIIVALTAGAFEEQREIILAEGCDDFIRKPFRETEIFDALTRHLNMRFVYDEITSAQDQDKEAKILDESLRDPHPPVALEAMPPDWIARLQQAIIDADFELMLILVEQIRETENLETNTAAILTDTLTELVYNFDYAAIQKLIDRTSNQPS